MNSRKTRILSAVAVGSATLLIGLGAQALAGLIGETVFGGSTVSETADAVITQESFRGAEPVTSKVVVVSSPDEDEAQHDAEIFFDPSGGYYTESVKLPAKFENLSNLEVVSRDWDNDRDEFPNGVPIAPHGSLSAGRTFKFKKIAIFNREIAFTTEIVGGISYRFSGTYPNPDFCETSETEDLPDLKGKLIMIKDGKWFGETEVKFYADGCGC